MKKKIIITILTMLFIFIPKGQALELATTSKEGIIIETTTGKIIFEKNSHEQTAPASMTKIMTLLLTFEKLDSGQISLDDMVHISEQAAGMGGSQMFLEANTSVRLEEIIKGVAIASANDGAVALAEYIGGSVENFVTMMNEKVSELGLENTHFVNPHGLDAENHYSSAYDMAIMALNLIKYEDVLKYTSTYEDYFNKPDGSRTWLVNTNKLVRFYNGVDGLKTGYTKNAGYCLTATAKKDNLRYITVLMGSPTLNDRSKETTEMLNYAFNSFKLNTIIDENTSLGQVKVEKGTEDYVDVVVKKTVAELIEINSKVDEYTYNLKIDKITAPVKKGDIVGKIEIMDNEGLIVKEENVTVAKDINKATYLQTLLKNFKTIITGKELNINKNINN